MESNAKQSSKIKACILGAGAAGLCAARHLARLESKFVFEVYEQTENVGGTWNYTDCIGFDINGLPIHTSMYKNMRTNLPMEVMEFPDFASNSTQSFVSHSQVLKYLQNYAIHFKLLNYIQFNHQIIQVSRSQNLWKVIIKNLKTQEIMEKAYDSIFVCNGRYAKPKIPNNIQGLDQFRGKVIHSHDYRVPQDFTNQNVLVLGAGPSGIDISIEISEVANQVVLCHQLKESFRGLPNNISQEITQIKDISETKITLENGSIYQKIDTIVFATGYYFDLTFLDKSCQIDINSNGRIQGLYLHFINTSFTSMAILGIINKVIPFRLYDYQVLLFIKCLTQEIALPSKTDMDLDTQRDLALRQSMGISERHAHSMSTAVLFFQYLDKLAEMSGTLPIKPFVKKLFIHLNEIRKNNITGYKDINFEVISDDNYVIKQ